MMTRSGIVRSDVPTEEHKKALEDHDGERTKNPCKKMMLPSQSTIGLTPDQANIIAGVLQNVIKRMHTGSCCYCTQHLPKKSLLRCEDPTCCSEFHLDCLKTHGIHNFQVQFYQMINLNKERPLLCHLHYCEGHMSRKELISAKRAPKETLVECLYCMRAFHDCCTPVGMQLLQEKSGKRWLICDRHHKKPPRRISSTKLPFCVDCKLENPKQKLIPCSTCPRQTHSFCYDEDFPPESSYGDSFFKQCPSCTRAVFARVDRACWYLDGKFIGVGVARRWSDIKCEKTKKQEQAGLAVIEKLATKYKLAGQYVVVPADQVVEFEKTHFSYYQKKALEDATKFQNPHGLQGVIKSLEKMALEKREALGTLPTYEHIMENDWSRIETLPYEKSKEKCSCKKSDQCGLNCNLWKKRIICKPECARRPGGCTNQLSLISDSNSEVDHTGDRGMGLYAKKSFKQGEPIVRFLGEIFDTPEMEKHERIGCNSLCKEFCSYQLMVTGTDLFVQPLRKGNNGRFANHSHDPNGIYEKMLVPQQNGSYLPEMVVVALADIEVDDEITVNYGSGYPMQFCLCGTEKCDTIPGGEWNVPTKKPVAKNSKKRAALPPAKANAQQAKKSKK